VTDPTQDELIEEIKKQLEDEKSAFDEYRAIAMIADSLGHYSVGRVLRDISKDEQRHSLALEQVVKQLSYIAALPGAELKRPFPQIYDDWADLGIDIGAKDPTLNQEVYDNLQKIYYKDPGSEEAKRWLVRKANELGIT